MKLTNLSLNIQKTLKKKENKIEHYWKTNQKILEGNNLNTEGKFNLIQFMIISLKVLEFDAYVMKSLKSSF